MKPFNQLKQPNNMKNLEQTLAKTILIQYNSIWKAESSTKDWVAALQTVAMTIWGQEIVGQIPLDFIGNLEKIANSEPKANLVEVSRFEAYALHKHYNNKSQEAQKEGLKGLAESYKAKKWLDIACEIEKADADDVNKNLLVG